MQRAEAGAATLETTDLHATVDGLLPALDAAVEQYLQDLNAITCRIWGKI
jgi:anti-sigma factor RsiW